MRSALAHPRPTVRDREVNWGDKTTLTGNAQKTLAWASVDTSQGLIVYASARVTGAPDVVCVANIEWGHGGASLDQDFAIIERLRVPLAASMVKITGRLVDAKGKAPPPNVKCDVSVVIAPGADSETLRNTRWVHQSGAAGVVSNKPERVMRVEGFNAGAADTWLMVFDGKAEPGAFPAMATPARAGRRFLLRRFDSQGFVNFVTWAASSTPLTFTADPRASLRVDTELLL